jgi:DNA-binding MarR family transcriptional regulator
MLRRAHQIAVALFSEETGAYNITTSQYGVLWLLSARPHLDQISVSKLMGFDRSTTALVVAKLQAAGLITRRNSKTDRRKNVLELTSKGSAVIEQLVRPAGYAQGRLLSVFTESEAKQFLKLLEKLIVRFATIVRTPIFPEELVIPPDRPAPSRRAGRANK